MHAVGAVGKAAPSIVADETAGLASRAHAECARTDGTGGEDVATRALCLGGENARERVVARENYVLRAHASLAARVKFCASWAAALCCRVLADAAESFTHVEEIVVRVEGRRVG